MTPPTPLRRWLIGCLTMIATAHVPACAQSSAPFEFTRMVAHWDGSYADSEYLTFIDDAQPQLAQIGFYGAHFWSLAHTPHGGGYPANFPVRGLDEVDTWFQQRNRQLHDRSVKVIGHLNVMFLVGEIDSPEGPRGFFKFYRDLWNVEQLGPKPVDDPIDLLERDVDGQPIVNNSYNIGGMREYWACLRNPHWRTVLRAWVKHGIERGVDGFVANYFYRHNCLCAHCQSAFRAYLADQFTPDQLRDEFGIDDLSTHRFTEIVAWHDPAESTPLRRQMLRWSQIANKQAFDDVFVRYGRSLKPDLIVAQWNHLGNFNQINGDEKCMLPADLWSRDESYTWYSTGDSANYSDLEQHDLGDATLQARYTRGAFADKPFTLGKYEHTRVRTAIAELAANGGAPMGFYTRFTDPAARREIVRYYQFLRRYEDVYHAARPHSEVLLLYPRTALQRGDVDAVGKFRDVGRALLDQHVLFDILPDDQADTQTRRRYQFVVTPDDSTTVPAADDPHLSQFLAPWTVRISAGRPAGDDHTITLHFVNYNREEPPKASDGRPSRGGGIDDEKPIEVRDIRASLLIPADHHVISLHVMTPESPDPIALSYQHEGERINFKLPPFLIYAVAQLRTAPNP